MHLHRLPVLLRISSNNGCHPTSADYEYDLGELHYVVCERILVESYNIYIERGTETEKTARPRYMILFRAKCECPPSTSSVALSVWSFAP